MSPNQPLLHPEVRVPGPISHDAVRVAQRTSPVRARPAPTGFETRDAIDVVAAPAITRARVPYELASPSLAYIRNAFVDAVIVHEHVLDNAGRMIEGADRRGVRTIDGLEERAREIERV